MNRRLFLASVPIVVGGCRDPRPTPQPHPSADERQAHLTMLANCRVPAGAVRTTPKPAVDVVEQFPELKPLVKGAVRLHPRFSKEPSLSESKLGGLFHWPADEEWPRCPEFQIPMQPVLQLRAEDAPAQFPFRSKADLFQLFWTPKATKAGPPHVAGVWRTFKYNVTCVGSPPTDGADLGYIPVPCRFFPERVAELPPIALMPAAMRAELEAWQPPVDYHAQLATAPGTKAGGWPAHATVATCRTCVRPMDYLLTVDPCEWTESSKPRWKPAEDPDREGYRRAAGFNFGPHAPTVQIYICRRCEKWPLRAVIVQPTA